MYRHPNAAWRSGVAVLGRPGASCVQEACVLWKGTHPVSHAAVPTVTVTAHNVIGKMGFLRVASLNAALCAMPGGDTLARSNLHQRSRNAARGETLARGSRHGSVPV